MCHITKGCRVVATILTITILVMAVGSCSTTKSGQTGTATTAGVRDSLLTDSDGNKYPVKTFLDGNLWMTTNLNLNIPDTYCYDNASENCKQYGRLYTWESAKQGCKLLGDNWRLPSAREWAQLSKLYGGNPEDSIASRKGAFKTLLHSGTSGFNAVLGGGRDLDNRYARLEAHGFYWTDTPINDSIAWYYNFAKGSQALYQQDGGEKTEAFSVRCVNSKSKLE